MKTPTQEFKDLIEAEGVIEVAKPQKEIQEVPESIQEALESTLTTLAPSELERNILEYSLQGRSIAQTSFALGIPESHIRAYLRNPKIKEYLKELKEAMNEIDQLMLTGALRKMVGARIKDIEDDPDSSYSELSNKDTLDIIKTFADISAQISKGTDSKEETNVFTNIYQQIM